MRYLYPIFLVEHKSEWDVWYEEEVQEMCSFLPTDYIKRISHIGSTAMGEICAKDIVDILLEVNGEEHLKMIGDLLMERDWICMGTSSNGIAFKKGYTPSGFSDRVFHLHIRVQGDNDELYFRDYMKENRDLALKYEELKINLWKKFAQDREGYTAGKHDFIVKYTQLAKEKYPDRYKSL